MTDEIIIPRSFKLIAEYEKTMKDPAVGISLGLLEDDDIELKTWNAMIYGFGLNSRQFQNNDWQLHLECSEEYPNVPPKIKFVERVPLDIVDKNNFVINSKVSYLANWNRECTLEQAVLAIRDLMNRY